MFYSNARLLHPKVYNQPEYRIPETAQLAGIMYDFDNHCVVTYDRVEGKLLWLTREAGAVEMSAIAPLPNSNYLIDMCQFQNTVYCLVYTGDGHLSVCVGSLQEGKDTGIVNFNEYPVPYYIPPTVPNLWAATHTADPTYFRYHPKYCGIMNIGHELYLMLGVSSDVESDMPPELGQYLVYYDISGLLTETYLLDNSTSAAGRPASMTNVLNGLHVACTYHDGVVVLVAESHYSSTGVLRYVKIGADALIGEVDTRPFFMGPFPIGTSMCAAGRHVYYLTGNRIFAADIFMFDVWCNDEGELKSNTIDMGIITSEQIATRKVTLQNSSPYYTYSNLIIESRDPNMTLAHISDTPVFADRIKIPGTVPVGGRCSFLLRVVAPKVLEVDAPKYYYDRLSIKAEGEW